MKTSRNIFMLFILGMSLLAACSAMQPSAPAQPTPTSAPVDVSNSAIVSEGKIIPKDSVKLSFSTGGQVEEVLVKKGDLIHTGDVIARLGNRKQLEATITAAEQELLAAQQAYNALFDNLPTAQNQALQALNQARQAEHDAENHLTGISGTVSQADIDVASAQVVFAKNALDTAKKNYAPYAGKPENDLTRARLQIALSNAQKAYDAAVRKYNGLVGTVNDFDRKQAETDLLIAQNNLKLAQDTYDKLQKGPDPDEVTAAKARIDTAQSQLASSKDSLNNLDLRSTIDGTVVDINLKAGEFVTPGTPVISLADFSQWYVETNNLTELEVANVAVSQGASVVPDALPDVQLTGKVESISNVFEEKQGDVTYTTRILLDNTDPRLRWGMTVVVTFEKQ
jgi:multidrug resistance efflux pump